MSLTGVSDNVGGVKRVATTLPHALEQERHFALIGEVLNPTKARFLISIQVGNSIRPMHLFGHKFDHDYYFELLREEEAGGPGHRNHLDLRGCPVQALLGRAR